MSADNGVYIFRTTDQIRVVHANAIDNLTFSFIDPNFLVHHPQEYVPTRVIEYFGECSPYTELLDAVSEAETIYAGLKKCEHGISLLPAYKRSWEQLVKDAVDYAKKELEELRKRHSTIYIEDMQLLEKIILLE